MKTPSHWPVIGRCGLYFFIAYLTPFIAELRNVGPNVIWETWCWVDWTTLNLECLLAGLLVIRVYIDSSFKQHIDDIKASQNAQNGTP